VQTKGGRIFSAVPFGPVEPMGTPLRRMSLTVFVTRSGPASSTPTNSPGSHVDDVLAADCRDLLLQVGPDRGGISRQLLRRPSGARQTPGLRPER
jgi:hypothetical protein